MAKPELILASKSPRRAMLLTQVGIRFRVVEPDAPEAEPTDGDFDAVAMRNALLKSQSVVGLADGLPILGADTMVNLDGAHLGKPASPDDARRMLRALSGRTHRVHTGIALLTPDGRALQDAAVTAVTFRELEAREIEDYIATGEPFDKAGAYGIQARGALFIERVDGCFFNVMGLPLAKFWELYKAAADFPVSGA